MLRERVTRETVSHHLLGVLHFTMRLDSEYKSGGRDCLKRDLGELAPMLTFVLGLIRWHVPE